ncbi:protein MIZU-KUSSEI 1 [Sorghum bicolor]|uniref:Protein MIZU-KUSSEI 1 n=1 Tax=Sorghum bicolor TaxID=4558 RepID=A0A194YJ09_SORBI|nr:protein MIZU-KUSSEI 1 [Sorghum bicolor]KXG19959.1 hypothetical protein SORBI_3010G138300 [Sorghum bicolor]|eukprot:XP_002436989.2 protein MIZU-KUSSEI 1 [Sorghum bicolor]
MYEKRADQVAMARAFHAASPATVPDSPSPLPSKNAGGGLANFQWLLRKRANKVQQGRPVAVDQVADDGCDDDECASMFAGATPYIGPIAGAGPVTPDDAPAGRKRRSEALSRLRSAILAVLARARRGRGRRPLGSCDTVTGTIFGRRRGRVHLALQTDPRAPPALMVELAAYSTGALVREMASGLVRLALECEKEKAPAPPLQTGDRHHQRRPRQQAAALVEEATWRAYCNGRKCGYAVRRDCGADEWRVLRAVEPVSVGAGVLPDGNNMSTEATAAAGEGDLMYMRAKFERVVGSRDSEAFYMVNPDGGGGPELSIYLLRV